MKRFIGFVIKEFYHIFRDKRTMLILFGMPVVQLLIFGFVITNDIKDANIAIFDQSNDYNTTKITQKLLSSGYFKLAESLTKKGDIEQSFKSGKVKMIVVYESNFSEKLEKEGIANIQIITDASEPNTASLLVNYASGIVNDYLKEISPQNQMNIQITPKVRMFYNQDMKSVYMFIPGIMAMLLMLISAMMTSISITREKELGTMEILLVSPLKPIQIVVGKVMPYILMAFLDALIILALGYFVFEMPVKGSIVLLLAETILFILTALSLGIFISTVTKTQQEAMMISQVALLLPTILLSGFIYPIENMPIVLQWISQLMPPKWFITIIKNVMIKGTGFTFIWKETLVLILMTVFFIFLSIKKFKIRLE